MEWLVIMETFGGWKYKMETLNLCFHLRSDVVSKLF
jgi:hypothetical protein